MPPSVQEWLPEAHLARYVVDVVEQLDLSAMERAYAGKGSDTYERVAEPAQAGPGVRLIDVAERESDMLARMARAAALGHHAD